MVDPNEPNIRERVYEVDQNFDGWRLDRFLANRMSRLSRSRAGEIAKEGDIEIDPPRKVKAGTRLRNGDRVIVREHLPAETVQDDEVTILFEDEALIVVNKPAGMLVHEAANVRLNTIQAYLERRGYHGAEPAHRIDRETSGALICARLPEWVTPLRDMFATDHPRKIYRALVLDAGEHWAPGVRRTIDIPLGLDVGSELGIRMVRGHLHAVTHVEALERLGDLADLKVQIETGRQHQIRAHLEFEGTPIAGDKLYGKTDRFFMDICDRPDDPDLNAELRFRRHALHAWEIEFLHPQTRQKVEIRAPLPAIWDAARNP